MAKYDFKKVEKKWQKYWAQHPELWRAEDFDKREKKYILDMFPYPSAEGLHVGHVESYTATDIVSRYLRMCGKNVLRPQGFDAFGLPAENFAIKTKTHPAITTQKAIETYKKQMDMLGFSYDWSREVVSTDPEYYKWTQWFFLLLYKNGLAYKKKAKVNWCDNCQTVLANEQAEGGICERCKNQVMQRDLEQWFFKITDFIEDKGKTSGLINGLEKVDWPDSTKAAQRNWIGKSEGAQFEMSVEGSDEKIEVFTTRLDTVFGMTYAIIAPEHPKVQKLKPLVQNWDEVQKYIDEAKKKSELQRISETKEKTGVELKGVKVINPFTKEAIPLFASDYVLAYYGTGAIMAVPAHDERDFAFAEEYDLEIRPVIKPTFDGMAFKKIIDSTGKVKISGGVITYWPESKNAEDGLKKFIEEVISGNRCYAGDGILTNSNDFNDLTSEDARQKLTEWLEKEGIGRKVINYKLRDWLVSRQRYWGAPIPIIYCEKCGEVPVPEKDLPVELPDDVDFMPTGESPLVSSKKFHNVKCSVCGGPAKRESDTMDTFVCSSWYYFRYADNKNSKEFAAKNKIKYWLPVDLYVGGAEHTVLHLLYARFFTKVLHNLGYIDFDEPFTKLRHQGIILGEDNEKMSKSRGNVINPNDVVAEYGADALRMFEMFMGPLEDMKPWNTKGIVGIKRFLDRAWKISEAGKFKDSDDVAILLNKTIKKVTEDIEDLKFNTAISQLMIFLNEAEGLSKDSFEKYVILLSPFAPHMAEEIWNELGHKKSVFAEKWPEYDPALVKEEIVEMIVQINGKMRGKFSVPAEISEEEAKKLALSDEKIKTWLEDKEPKKVIFEKGRLVNFVI